MNKRIYVEKKDVFQTTAQNLLVDLQKTLKIENLKSLKMIQIYDVLNVEEDVYQKACQTLFQEEVTDNLYEEYDLSNKNYICIEALTGQFDQRADSAIRGLILLGADAQVNVKTAVIYLLNDEVTEAEKMRITDYLVNPLENQIKDLSLPIDRKLDVTIKPVETIIGFTNFNRDELLALLEQQGLAMLIEDLTFIQDYFKKIKRDPSMTELLVLDTYWSDHCRHTTFETHLENIDFSKSNVKSELEAAYEVYKKLRSETDREEKPMTLMDMASIQAKYQRQAGTLDDMEISDEVNACSIEIDVDVDGKDEKYLLMYKNETHNHPTEIEPFGGASTCVGGAIRDPLSGRAYVYQALRVTGAGNITEDITKTRAHKLPQKTIAQRAAAGNSSYGNQIGCPTTFQKELFHPGYVAKRMELGAVVGAVKKADVVRKQPEVGDYVLILGAPTGRDGVGGATGSSKIQDKNALEEAMSEVQKGNAPEERKLQRLFRNPEVTKLIKKANDFGAGGVSVAIGELADGLSVNLDVLPTKYDGLNGTDLAISESQERMAVVIAAKDFDKFKELAYEENVKAIKVAEVTEKPVLEINWRGQKVVDLDRDFLDTNGVAQKITPVITSSNENNPFTDNEYNIDNNFVKSVEKMATDLNNASLIAESNMFDSTVGHGTIVAPYGGKYQATMSEASIQKIPVIKGFTQTASIMAMGANPNIGLYEPFYAGSYAIIEAVARLVASGADWTKARLTLQEYFEKVSGNPERFGKPVAALLGALQTQYELNLPALGGKDSMSGSFEEINVPPTVVAFAITTVKSDQVITNEFKKADENVYVLVGNNEEKINYDLIRNNFNLMNKLQKDYKLNTVSSIKDGGILNALTNMAYGNNIGVVLNDKFNLDELFMTSYGGFIFTSDKDIDVEGVELIGTTIQDKITYNNEAIIIKDLLTKSQAVLEDLYTTTFVHRDGQVSNRFDFNDLKLQSKEIPEQTTYSFDAIEQPLVYIPAFVGTNCEYDVQSAFEAAGAKTLMIPFVDIDQDAIEKSINTMVETLDKANIFALSGGFSAGDEPDGSGKYILNILLNERVQDAIRRFQAREGLIIGICNGFQVLIKSGLLPYGEIGKIDEKMPTLFLNERGKHIARFVDTKVNKSNSPWLSKVSTEENYTITLSHGEGKFYADNETLSELFNNNQIVSQYVDFDGNPTMDYRFNPNGSYAAVEGLVSPDGRIIGKMGHSERYESGNYKNIIGQKELALFESAVAYFQKK